MEVFVWVAAPGMPSFPDGWYWQRSKITGFMSSNSMSFVVEGVAGGSRMRIDDPNDIFPTPEDDLQFHLAWREAGGYLGILRRGIAAVDRHKARP